MPRNDMSKMLKELGVEPPNFSAAVSAAELGEGQIQCARCGQVKPKMASPPFRNAQGQMIQEKICADCWAEWQRAEVMVINELRLNFMDPKAQEILAVETRKFLLLED